MIVDSSAVIVILRQEEDAVAYTRAIAAAGVRRISAASYLECAIVLDSQRNPVVSRALDVFVADTEMVIESLTEHHARLARH